MTEILSFKTEEDIRNYRIKNGGSVWSKKFNPETGMIDVEIQNFNTQKYLPISFLESYKVLSEEAKKVIKCIKYDDEDTVVCIKIGESFFTDNEEEIQMTEELYKELFDFVKMKYNGIGYARYDGEDGIEEIQIWLPIDRGIQLE